MKEKEKPKKQLASELRQALLRIDALEKRIAELEKNLNEVKESEAKYRTIADNSFDWEFWLSAGADFIYCSPSARRITGYEPEDFLSDPGLFFRIIHPDDLHRVAENLNRKRAEKGHCELEFRIITRMGEERRIVLAFLGIYDESGKYLGIRGSSRDFSEMKQPEQNGSDACR